LTPPLKNSERRFLLNRALHQSYKLCFGTQNIFAPRAGNYFVLPFNQLARLPNDTRNDVYMSITESLMTARAN
jgi:hypothetical protein